MSLTESRRPSLRDKIESIEDEIIEKQKKADRKARKPKKVVKKKSKKRKV